MNWAIHRAVDLTKIMIVFGVVAVIPYTLWRVNAACKEYQVLKREITYTQKGK